MLVYFDKDSNLLYGLIEVSAAEVLDKFIKIVVEYKKKLLGSRYSDRGGKVVKGRGRGQPTLTKIEKMVSFEYTSLEEYLQDSTTFEVMASLHNGKERIFYFINTLKIPVVTQEKKLSKMIKKGEETRFDDSFLTFSFEELNEPLESTKFCLNFTNEMGISEQLENLVFCEVMVKDNQKIRFLDSGIRSVVKTDRIDQGNQLKFDYIDGEAFFVSLEFERNLFKYRFRMVYDKQKSYMLLQEFDLTMNSKYFVS